MAFLQTWIIAGNVISQAPCASEHIRAEVHPPYSLAFFCPKCGEVWARRVITPNTNWNAITHECPKHQSPRSAEPGGSVWINYNSDFINNLPREVLRYETLLRLEKDEY